MSHNSSDGLWSLRRPNDWTKIWMKKLNGGDSDPNIWLAVPVRHPDSGPNWEHYLSFPANPTDEHWQASCLMPLFLQRRQEWMWLAQSVALRKGCSAVIQLLFVCRLRLNRKWVHACQTAPRFQSNRHSWRNPDKLMHMSKHAGDDTRVGFTSSWTNSFLLQSFQVMSNQYSSPSKRTHSADLCWLLRVAAPLVTVIKHRWTYSQCLIGFKGFVSCNFFWIPGHSVYPCGEDCG